MDDPRAPLIVLTGPPAVGKTTVAEIVADRFEPSAVVAGDHFLQYLRRGRIEPWLPASHGQNTDVIELTVAAAVGYTAAGWTTVLEGIIGPWFLDTVRRVAGDGAVHYVVLEAWCSKRGARSVVLEAPLEECLRRAAAREAGVGDEVVAKMHDEFTRAELADRHRVGADRPPAEVAADLLGRLDQGRLELGDA